MQLAVPGYIVGVLMLLGVALFGEVVNGSRRWLHVGVTRIQALGSAENHGADDAGLVLPKARKRPALAPLSGGRGDHHHPSLFILKQPDLGTATLIMASVFLCCSSPACRGK